MSYEKTENLITKYRERSLHSFLKKDVCPDNSKHELKIGRYVADACDGEEIFEIQTGNLKPLAKKLQYYIENTDHRISIVHPIAQNKKIFWVDESGEIKKAPRTSSRHENICHGISDLYYVKEFIGNERISFCFVLMEIDEIRLLDGYGKNKKVRATSVDKIAGDIYSRICIKNEEDIANVVLPLLPDSPFSREEMSSAFRLKGMKLWSIQKLLLELGLIASSKEGRRLIFEKVER